jgi:hypothetical protein
VAALAPNRVARRNRAVSNSRSRVVTTNAAINALLAKLASTVSMSRVWKALPQARAVPPVAAVAAASPAAFDGQRNGQNREGGQPRSGEAKSPRSC